MTTKSKPVKTTKKLASGKKLEKKQTLTVGMLHGFRAIDFLPAGFQPGRKIWGLRLENPSH